MVHRIDGIEGNASDGSCASDILRAGAPEGNRMPAIVAFPYVHIHTVHQADPIQTTDNKVFFFYCRSSVRDLRSVVITMRIMNLLTTIASFALLPQCLSWTMKTGDVYPLSTRQALIEKSKSLQGSKSYSTVGWSNRAGTALTPAAIPGVYTADRPFYWNKIDVGCRMTVVEIEGGLWVHSPVGLDGPLKEHWHS